MSPFPSLSTFFNVAENQLMTGDTVQIRFILLQNRQGKTRLSRWYVPHHDDERRKIEAETHRIIVARDGKMTSFLEVSSDLTK